jgi:hypothetical protein
VSDLLEYRLLAGIGGLAAVGFAAGLGHLGAAFILAFAAPLALTAGQLQRRRSRGNQWFAAFNALPMTPAQRRFFTAWFLYTMFLAVAVVIGTLGAGLHAL